MNLDEAVQSAHENGLRANERTPDSEWCKNDFDLLRSINETKGVTFEIAGPTSYGYRQVEEAQTRANSRLEKPMYASNVAPGTPLYHPQTGELLGYSGKVDLIADGTSIPLKNESVGVLFVSCLPNDVSSKAIDEMARVVEPGGLVVWQRGVAEDGKNLLDKGFTLKTFQEFKNPIQNVFNFVCQKEKP